MVEKVLPHFGLFPGFKTFPTKFGTFLCFPRENLLSFASRRRQQILVSRGWKAECLPLSLFVASTACDKRGQLRACARGTVD